MHYHHLISLKQGIQSRSRCLNKHDSLKLFLRNTYHVLCRNILETEFMGDLSAINENEVA